MPEHEFGQQLQEIEQQWQDQWDEHDLHTVDTDTAEEEYYVLEMFPYPSGNLHMGHVRNFSLGDVLARYKRMQGYNVLHPMGWDAFGLPAENAAIDRDVTPGDWTFDCIDTMKGQLQRLGFSYDWTREVTTCTPDYYTWNQWLFLQMRDDGLAYRDYATVNWCPGCETVLADEQVEDGLCWRCDSVVEQKEMQQWFLQITDYADSLLNDLNLLDGWPDKVTKMQHDWIGKSHGAQIEFPLQDGGHLSVFTTRPDTIYGATYMVLAPEHPQAEQIAEENKEVATYIEDAKTRDADVREEKTKDGVFTGTYAENPVTGDELPLYVAEFVLMDYGTGAIMAVPAHDSRDHAFATEHDIPIQPVVEPQDDTDWDPDEEAFEGDGVNINSGPLNGLETPEAKEKIIDILEEEGRGTADTNFKLRDWLISRQRYWGTPIPIIYCDDCGTVPVPEDELPVELPEDVEFTPTGNPLETAEDWIQTECPDCGGDAERETDTMDTFVDSSWYFLRYCDPDNTALPFDPDAAEYWMNADQYIGGIEHAVLHLMYARFVTKFLRDIDMVDEDEPFERLLTQGMVLHPAWKTTDGDWLYPDEVDDYDDSELAVNGEVMKMSKSKKNVVDPEEMVDEYGADTARLFITRAALPQKELEWSAKGVDDSLRMLERIYYLVHDNDELITQEAPDLADAALETRIVSSTIQRTVEQVTDHMEDFEFNLAIDALDRLLTRLYWYLDQDPDRAMFSYGVRRLLEMMAPYAPHLADQLWDDIGEDGFLINAGWPDVDDELLDEEAEQIDQYHDRVARDIREITNMVNDFSTVKVIRAADWKYDVEAGIADALQHGDRNIGQIMDNVMTDETKQYGQQISDMVQDAAENPGTFQDRTMHKTLEQQALDQNTDRWANEFDANIVIESEDDSNEDKAKRARPGKPAIVLE